MIKFHHIEPRILCSDLHRSVAFYESLSFKLRDGSPKPEQKGAFMTAGFVWSGQSLVESGIVILLKQGDGAIAPQEFRIFTSDVEAFYAQQNLSGQPFASKITYWPHDYVSFDVIDPDGHKITFA